MKLKLLNAVLRLYESNMRNLHWNSKGGEFNDAHKSITTEYYELFADNIDKTAEILGMLNINPANYMEVSDILKEAEDKFIVIKSAKLYTRDEIVVAVNRMLKDIVDLLLEVLEEEEIKDVKNTGIRSELESILFTFDFQYRYLNKRRGIKE